MINEYLDKIIQARQDITISDAFRSYLIEFTNKAKNIDRFSLSLKSKTVLQVSIGNDNCICDILLKLDIKAYYINIFKDKRRFINTYNYLNELYDTALKALNENIF